jgi:signal transduction histidine kinase
MALARLCGHALGNVSSLAVALGVPAAASSLPQWRPTAAVASDRPRDELHDAVASLAALQPLQHELAAADTESELLTSARESARILFGVRDVVFLLPNANGNEMAVLPLAGQAPQLARLRFSLGAGTQGVCSGCAQSQRTRSSFGTEQALAIADLQLARALGSEGLLCVPMAAAAAVLGVMAFPVSRAQVERLAPRMALLSHFASLLARHLQSWRSLHERSRQRQAAAADEFQLRERQVVHEVSNPLGIIKNYLQIVRRKLPGDLRLDEELQVLNEEIDRVAKVVRQLGEPLPAPADAGEGLMDLNVAVEAVRALYAEPLFGAARIELVLKLQRPLAPTRADRDSVRQILVNLWKNAAEALPAGARVTTTTTDHVYREGQVYTQLCVADNGPGLPADALRTPFKPLGSGRRPGHSGLGLSITHSLVSRLGGHLSCQTAPQRGAQFFVLLPQGQP